jgi:hypothetical protein
MESFSKEVCNNGIMLDPRLRNYIQYKKAYDKNGIDTGVPLEKMFQISKEDLQTIRKFRRGKRDLYTMDKLGGSQDFVKPIKKKFENTNEKFRNDPHFKKLQQKMKNNRDAIAQKDNYSTMRNNYDMYSDNELSDRNMLNVEYKNTVRTPYKTYADPPYKSTRTSRKNSFLLDSRDDDLKYDNPNLIFQPEKRSNMVYHNEPKISMNERLRFGQNVQLKGLKQSQSYGDNYPSNINRPGLRSMEADNDMRFGMNSRGGKNIGYKNPFEHQFQFIDNDIQHPDHVVNDRGISTRLYNKSRTKYKRDIYR